LGDETNKVELYALSTCAWCAKTKRWLDDNRVDYQLLYVDQCEPEEKERARERILNFVSKMSFPMVIVDEGREIIQGYKPERYEEVFK